MDLLEVPLDALALRLYSLPAAAAVGSAWACLALLAAAALGLWGIRAVGSKPDPPPSPSSAPPPPPRELLSPACPAGPRTSEARKIAAPAQPSSCHVEEASTPKARFTAYYSASAESLHVEDDARAEDAEEEATAEDVDSVSDVDRRATAAWNGGWDLEWTAVKRRGDLGWYRFQDMAALDGSVVKLWDARDGGLTSPSGTGRCLRRRL